MDHAKFIITASYENVPPLKNGLRPEIFQGPSVSSKSGIIAQLKRAWALFREGRHAEVILLESTSGSIHPDLLAAILFSLLPRRKQPILIFMGAMWQPNQGLRHWIEIALIRLADRAMDGYIVQTSEEMTIFPAFWHIDPVKLEKCLYFYTLLDKDIHDDELVRGDYVFAGGNSHRDYDALVEAARRMPERPFIIATHKLDGRTDLPPNVKAGTLTKQAYQLAMEGAGMVVTCISNDLLRGAGQQTYLNAMRLGKLSVVNEGVPGVHDHIVDGVNGFIVAGDADSYEAVIRWGFDPANQAESARIIDHARQDALTKFTYENHVEAIARDVDRIIERSPKKLVARA